MTTLITADCLRGLVAVADWIWPLPMIAPERPVALHVLVRQYLPEAGALASLLAYFDDSDAQDRQAIAEELQQLCADGMGDDDAAQLLGAWLARQAIKQARDACRPQ
ncbi:hypothetical protein SAMN06265795_12412 [Noviherbaspirillum humi]|uniref:Uncharacterized protein n=1 Tax=Noviherbaspirillum humi TaxID=1688639 RepID=A0A239LJS2_9BURK|nr:hypothetical protein [Noviherbaspirillum humi]SNT30927.1 hypothetical protein SAMN06265795_12412 [Noviherbaspirillum humi]